MPWNGSGGFNREEDFTADLAAGPPASIVSAEKVDDEFDNFKGGLQNCLTRDGQNSPSANISWAGYKITSLGAPSSGGDASNKTYVDALSYLGAGINGLGSVTPANDDLMLVADVSDSNNPKKITVQAILDAVVTLVNDGRLAQTADLKPTALATAPTGWLLCRGQAVSRTDYAALFSAIGTDFGSGDGSTTFNVPDLQGRVIAGVEATATRLTAAGCGIDGATRGASGGSQFMQQHTHTVTDPGHTHSVAVKEQLAGGSSAAHLTDTSGAGTNETLTAASATTGISLANAGTGTSQNVQPTIMLNWLIKT
jgi:microcystin-dependent protein